MLLSFLLSLAASLTSSHRGARCSPGGSTAWTAVLVGWVTSSPRPPQLEAHPWSRPHVLCKSPGAVLSEVRRKRIWKMYYLGTWPPPRSLTRKGGPYVCSAVHFHTGGTVICQPADGQPVLPSDHRAIQVVQLVKCC